MTHINRNTPVSSAFFNVYMPYAPDASCYTFEVPLDAKVRDIERLIRNHETYGKHLNSQAFSLFKCDLPLSTSRKPFIDVLEWLHTHHKETKMGPVDCLSLQFPSVSAPERDRKIDIVIATPSILEQATRYIISKFLSERDRSLREYIGGPEWKVFWEAPSSFDEQTRDFINYLKIPRVKDTGDPVLLLHDLGKDIVDSSVVDNLFTRESRFLVNTSGSGKTRLLFEGLTRHWGFYFTPAATTPENHFLGSTDLQTIIDYDIPESKGFVENPEILPAEKQGDAYRLNGSIAERRFSQVLTARCLIFEWFLKTIQEVFPDRPASEFRRHWLFLQLRSVDILVGGDVFRQLSDLLKDASDEFLLLRTGDVQDRMGELRAKFGLDEKIYLILDEAQVALHKMRTCFRSDQNQTVKRPILKPLIGTWKNLATSLPIVVCGTDLSIDIINETETTEAVKHNSFRPEMGTGSFDDRNRQRAYILRYLPKHIAESESGQEFISRAWTYCHGRHRFTAVLIGQLLDFAFQSPHTILNAYVEHFTGFRPSDCQDLVAREPAPDCYRLKQRIYSIVKLNFSKIVSAEGMMRETINALYSWILLSKRNEVGDLKGELVELGFARFIGIDEAYIDEPLVLLSAANELAKTPGSINNWVKTQLQDDPRSGEYFERCITSHLACRFDEDSFGELPEVLGRALRIGFH